MDRVQDSSTMEGWRGVLGEGGTTRRAVGALWVQALRGSLEGLYEASGCEDMCISAAVPGRITAWKTAAAVTATGAVQVQAIVWLTTAAVDAAVPQTIINRPAGPYQSAKSRIALYD